MPVMRKEYPHIPIASHYRFYDSLDRADCCLSSYISRTDNGVDRVIARHAIRFVDVIDGYRPMFLISGVGDGELA